MYNPDWFREMKLEHDALIANNTWSLMSLPFGVSVVRRKWTFKHKLNVDETFQHSKGRLVAKGFHQVEGLNYNDTFSPIVKLMTIRIVLTLVVSRHRPVHQIDIDKVFSHGQL